MKLKGYAMAALVAATVALAGCGGKSDEPPTAPANSVAAVAAPAGQDWTQVVEQTPEDGYRMGNPAAPLKLVEYGSRLCPGCRQFYMTGYQPLVEQYVKTGKVSYEFRDFPVHGPVDIPAILLGRCVAKEAYFPILDQMFENQPSFLDKQSKLSQERYASLQNNPVGLASYLGEDMGFIAFMQQRGVPEAKAKQCLGDMAAIERIAKNAEAAGREGVAGTPSFFLNGRKLDGGDWGSVQTALKAAGA
ncbi:thioredoxin domain-containing protein [Sphingomonas sp.]|uniref:DsbA family protein n=1 Tax=Sphingomonas sp. TaxID=28214 RepID=UPI001EBF8CEB|nr:thioredoxin domain-containing protein [Sphingomonas sp.]MBX3593677.1 thioredoxin domain-containing protein [Sphingomonas sp.]